MFSQALNSKAHCGCGRAFARAGGAVGILSRWGDDGRESLNLPPPLRYLIAYDTEACSAVRGAFIKALFAWLRLSAKKKHGLQSAQLAFPGAITFVQRFGGALNLNVHSHTLVTDGVFVDQVA